MDIAWAAVKLREDDKDDVEDEVEDDEDPDVSSEVVPLLVLFGFFLAGISIK
jgi:hypothetical protein